MALRHYDGPGLPGTEVKKVAPPPSAPKARPPVPPAVLGPPDDEPEPIADSMEGALDVLEETTRTPRGNRTQDHQIFTVAVTHLPSGTVAHASGLTPVEAFESAATELEAALPVRALVWDDGTPLEGLARQVLSAGCIRLSRKRASVVDSPIAVSPSRGSRSLRICP